MLPLSDAQPMLQLSRPRTSSPDLPQSPRTSAISPVITVYLAQPRVTTESPSISILPVSFKVVVCLSHTPDDPHTPYISRDLVFTLSASARPETRNEAFPVPLPHV